MTLRLGAILVLTFASSAAASEPQFVQASRINLRQKPDLQSALVARIPIGTSVEILTRERAGGWCQIRTATAQQGFTLCKFLGAQRPRLADFLGPPNPGQTPKLGTPAYDDFLLRRFFLSPSLSGLLAYARAHGIPLAYGGESPNLQTPPKDVQKKAPKLYTLIGSLKGPLLGTDLQPNILNAWNNETLTKELALADKSKPEMSVILAGKASFFSDADDALILAGGLALIPSRKRTGVHRSPSGKAEVRLRTTLPNTPPGILIEYSKLLQTPVVLEHLPPFDAGYSGRIGLGGIGGIKATYPKRPTASFLLEDGRWQYGTLVSTSAPIRANQCGGSKSATVMFALPQPAKKKVLVVLLSRKPLTKNRAVIMRWGDHWSADLDGDGVADLAGTQSLTAGELEATRTLYSAKVFINIAGWRTAARYQTFECT